MAQIKGGLFAKGGGNNGGVGFPVIEITLDQVDNDDINFTEEQFNQIMACGNFTLKFPDGTFYNFIGTNNSLQASAYFYAIQDNQTTTPTELQILQLSIVKSTYVGTISPNVYTNGGGGGGSQLYQHNIRIRYYKSDGNYNFVATFVKVSSKSTAFTDAEIQGLCSNARTVVGGFHGINQAPQPITSVQYVTGTTNKWRFNYWTGATNTYQSYNEADVTLEDTVEDTL